MASYSTESFEATHEPLTDGTIKRRQLTVSFLKLFLPIATLIFASAFAVGNFQVEHMMGELAAPEQISTTLASKLINHELARPLRHLQSLAHAERDIQQFLRGTKGTSPATLVDAFTSLLSRNPEYAQISWIGEDGFERVRVDSEASGQAKVIPQNELQDKHDRYYVIQTLRLKRGEIYVSPLDLNIERGQVEVPYQPTIRLSIRVFGPGEQPNGMFILNVSAREMLDTFAHAAGTLSDMTLLNEDGYWLKSAHAEDEWGFMFGKKDTFGQRFPLAWQLISASESGQRETPGGLWTWQTIHVTPENISHVNAVNWKAASHIPAAQLSERHWRVWWPVAGGAFLLLLLFGWGMWRLAKEMTARRCVEDSLSLEKINLIAANSQLSKEVSERVWVETELAKSMAELERSNRELDDFAYIASHDLKEPLRGLHNYASFLKEDYADRLDDEGRRYLDRMQRLVERLTKLIDCLLEYSRLGSSELPMQAMAFDAVLDEVSEDLKPFLTERGVKLIRDTPLPTVNGNAMRIGEVLQNLITNAAKYSDKSEKWVKVGCKGTTPPVFYVRDNGIGIAPQHQDSVFRIFKRLHEQDKYGGGSGAGLTIVKKIIERHGGRIWLESTHGEGTTFYFTLTGTIS